MHLKSSKCLKLDTMEEEDKLKARNTKIPQHALKVPATLRSVEAGQLYGTRRTLKGEAANTNLPLRVAFPRQPSPFPPPPSSLLPRPRIAPPLLPAPLLVPRLLPPAQGWLRPPLRWSAGCWPGCPLLAGCRLCPGAALLPPDKRGKGRV